MFSVTSDLIIKQWVAKKMWILIKLSKNNFVSFNVNNNYYYYNSVLQILNIITFWQLEEIMKIGIVNIFLS